MDFVGGTRRHGHVLMNGPVVLQVQRQLMLAGRDVQALKESVKVVDHSRVVAIHIDCGLLRLDLDSKSGAAVVIRRVIGIRIERGRPPRIGSPKRIVKIPAHEYDAASTYC
jgi:hypothetical protein